MDEVDIQAHGCQAGIQTVAQGGQVHGIRRRHRHRNGFVAQDCRKIEIRQRVWPQGVGQLNVADRDVGRCVLHQFRQSQTVQIHRTGSHGKVCGADARALQLGHIGLRFVDGAIAIKNLTIRHRRLGAIKQVQVTVGRRARFVQVGVAVGRIGSKPILRGKELVFFSFTQRLAQQLTTVARQHLQLLPRLRLVEIERGLHTGRQRSHGLVCTGAIHLERHTRRGVGVVHQGGVAQGHGRCGTCVLHTGAGCSDVAAAFRHPELRRCSHAHAIADRHAKACRFVGNARIKREQVLAHLPVTIDAIALDGIGFVGKGHRQCIEVFLCRLQNLSNEGLQTAQLTATG